MGYSFNLTGSTLYLAMAALFAAQAGGLHLSVLQQVVLLATLALSSKGIAGVPRAIQQQWIRSGLSILRSHDLNPRVFVAPRHGFDRGTLWALRKEGVEVLSDGAGRVAHRRNGLIWIPQQLWAPVDHKCGLWTICLHPNTTGERALRKLEEFLKLHAEQFTSVDRVLKEMRPGIRSPQETAYAAVQMSRLLLSRRLRRLLHSRLLR